MTPFPTRRGMTLLEVASALAMLALLSTVLAAAAAESRRHGSLTQNLANLQQFAAGTSSYGAAYQDRFWSFSWREGYEGDPRAPQDDITAIADQAIEIIRRRGDRPDINSINLWYAPAHYSHLVLLDYLQTDLLAPFVVGPEDHLLQLWRSDPEGIFDLPRGQRPSGFGDAVRVCPYSSSYELAPAFYAYDSRTDQGSTVDQHGLSFGLWNGGQAWPSGRTLSEVAFPSQKVMVYERYQRHFGPREVYFMYEEARIPLLFADGSASVRRTEESDAGFRPNNPAVTGATIVEYDPGAWLPPPLSGRPADAIDGHYRWTRGGLKGRDFGAGEIDTSDW